MDVHECSGVLQMAPSPLDKQAAGCNSSDNWLMSFAIYLTALCDLYRGENGTNGCHLAVFSSLCLLLQGYPAAPTLPPYRSASGISYSSKKLSTMADISASYPLNSWWIDRL